MWPIVYGIWQVCHGIWYMVYKDMVCIPVIEYGMHKCINTHSIVGYGLVNTNIKISQPDSKTQYKGATRNHAW